MAILKVTFPHYDDEGNWYHAGDYREVPDHLVEFYLRPDLRLGVRCLAVDPEVWSPAETSAPNKPFDRGPAVDEAPAPVAPEPEPEAAVEEAPAEEPAAEEAPAPAEDAPADGKKRKK